MINKLGRLSRTFNPAIPHYSALKMMTKPIPLPSELDYSEGMPDDLGTMLNDILGNCTCAGYYHALQILSYHTNKVDGMITQPDICILRLYEEACGYMPGLPQSDRGGNEQSVLTFLLNTGAPTGLKSETRHKLRAFVEINPRNFADIQRSIYECGVVYLGCNMPANVMQSNIPQVWDYIPNSQIVGGHCIIACGYTKDDCLIISSWGKKYYLTPQFQLNLMDESYSLCDINWFNETGLSLLGMSVKELKAQMKYLVK
jgi:hypothetical protein